MRIMKLHLYTEFFLNAAIAAYLRTDDAGIDRINLRYHQKAVLLKETGLLEADSYDFLVKLNALRNKISHRLEYQLSQEDLDGLQRGLMNRIPEMRSFDFARVAAFLAGYLGASVDLAQRAAARLSDTTISATQST